MEVIPQYEVFCLYNYDRVICVTKKLMQREIIEVRVKRKDAFNLNIKIV